MDYRVTFYVGKTHCSLEFRDADEARSVVAALREKGFRVYTYKRTYTHESWE